MQIAKSDLKGVETRMQEFGLPVGLIRKETAFALQTINSNAKLLECDKKTILAAIVQAANIGLSLNPAANECALIPRRTRNGFECTLMPMYQGICNLAYKSGNVAQINTVEVCEKDCIKLKPYDTENPVEHSHGFGDRGKPVGYYTLITYKDGSKQLESMDIEEVQKIRNSSDGYQAAKKYNRSEDHPWEKWFSEMARKSCLKRALKYANKAGADEKLIKAIEADNSDYRISIKKQGFIEGLIRNSTFDDDHKAMLEDSLPYMGDDEANQLIDNLQAHQLADHPGWNDRVNKTTVGKQVKAAVENDRT